MRWVEPVRWTIDCMYSFFSTACSNQSLDIFILLKERKDLPSLCCLATIVYTLLSLVYTTGDPLLSLVYTTGDPLLSLVCPAGDPLLSLVYTAGDPLLSLVYTAGDPLCREDVVSALNEAIDRREEGLVLKMPSGTYKPDKRKGEI